MTTPHFHVIDSGALEGCVKINWGDYWYCAIFVMVGTYSILIPLSVKLSLSGRNFLGILVYPLLYVFAVSFIAPWCGLRAFYYGSTVQLVCNMIIVGLFIVAGIINGNAKFFLKHDSPLGFLINKRIGKPQKGWMETDFLLIGPINEFLSMSAAELICVLIFCAWLGLCAWVIS